MERKNGNHKPKRKMGRPTLFTSENCEKILNSVRLGAADKICGNAAGVSYDTFRGWVRQGEDEGKGEYFDFSVLLKKAKGERVDTWLKHIDNAAPKNWQAAAWKLERLHPDLYGRTIQRVEHTRADGKGPTEIIFPDLSSEENQAHYRALFPRTGQECSESGTGGNGDDSPAPLRPH